MSDMHLNFRAQPHERPGDDEAREARHQVLATLLGAYADSELPPETVAQIDAHLLGCARCRREVEVHSVLRQRMQREPLSAASATLRDRISAQIAASTPAVAAVPQSAASQPWWRSRMAPVAGLAVIALLGAGMWLRRDGAVHDVRTAQVAVAEVPLLQRVLADYRDVVSRDLPGRARDLDAVRAAVPFPVAPLQGDGVRLLAAWSTDLQGEPAAVLAYRWQDRLVLEYLVAEPVFFRHPSVRTPIAAGASVTAMQGAQGVVAWAAPESGVILVGDASLADLLALRAGVTAR